MPQFALLVCWSIQAPLHRVWPAGHASSSSSVFWHRPSVHVSSSAQTVPHSPQLKTSFVVVTQAPSQSVCPCAQAAASAPAVQVPPTHVWVSAQALPQRPQFFASVCRSTHALLQRVWSSGQARVVSGSPVSWRSSTTPPPASVPLPGRLPPDPFAGWLLPWLPDEPPLPVLDGFPLPLAVFSGWFPPVAPARGVPVF